MLIAIHEDRWTLEALADRAGLNPALLERYVEFGLIEPVAKEGSRLYFDPAVLPRIRKIRRLRDSLGINLAGISVVLDLLDRMRAMRRE